MSFKIIKNFLDKEKFEKVKNTIVHKEFPWRLIDKDTEVEGGYFTHSLFYNCKVNSDYNFYITNDIYEILKPAAIIQARVNLTFSSLFNNKPSKWHIDYDFGNYTSIFYLNDTEGGTEVKINDKIHFIKAEENKMLIMKGNVYHRGLLSPDVEKRYIINFNYFGEKNEFES